MSDGIDNLARLFETEHIVQPNELTAPVFQRESGKMRGSLDRIKTALNSEPREGGGDLSHAVNVHWPRIGLRELIESAAIPFAPTFGSHRSYEIPYASGHRNAAYLYFDPLGTKPEAKDVQGIMLIQGMYWKFSETPIRTSEKVLVSGKLEPNKLKAFELYLDKIEEGIENYVAGLEGEALTPRQFFFIGPDIGLSLISFGDALLKVAPFGEEMAREYLTLASRAYRSSGFRDTMYVGKKLLEIGEIPPRTYISVRVDMLPIELVQKLTGKTPAKGA